jgi:glutamate synthase domain-containing protein 3
MDKKPVMVIGGSTGDFLGEYMAGGIVMVLGLSSGGKELTGRFCATGIHGGVIYLRGEVDRTLLGKEAMVQETTPEDMKAIQALVEEFCGYFGGNAKNILNAKFLKISAASKRPYGKMYVGV